MPSPIRKQVKLPLSVAFGVVMQGIRIRLGRSLVTLAGVILGIAFLMSILVGQSIRRGVAAEVNTRREVKRMMSFLTAETGPLDDRVIGVVQVGPLGVEELRFLKQVAAAKVSRLNWVTRNGAQAPGGLAAAGRVSAVSEPEVGRDASAVLLAGEGEVPGGAAAGALLDGARQKVLAFTRKSATAPDVPDASVVQLEREIGRASCRERVS